MNIFCNLYFNHYCILNFLFMYVHLDFKTLNLGGSICTSITKALYLLPLERFKVKCKITSLGRRSYEWRLTFCEWGGGVSNITITNIVLRNLWSSWLITDWHVSAYLLPVTVARSVIDLNSYTSHYMWWRLCPLSRRCWQYSRLSRAVLSWQSTVTSAASLRCPASLWSKSSNHWPQWIPYCDITSWEISAPPSAR